MVTAKFGGGGPLHKVTCARCDAPRELPKPDRPRLPAANADGSTTLEADTACAALTEGGGRCGSKRVRVALNF